MSKSRWVCLLLVVVALVGSGLVIAGGTALAYGQPVSLARPINLKVVTTDRLATITWSPGVDGYCVTSGYQVDIYEDNEDGNRAPGQDARVERNSSLVSPGFTYNVKAGQKYYISVNALGLSGSGDHLKSLVDGCQPGSSLRNSSPPATLRFTANTAGVTSATIYTAPVLAPIDDVRLRLGEAVDISAAAVDADGDRVSYEWSGSYTRFAPNGDTSVTSQALVFSQGTVLNAARLMFTPTDPGVYDMQVAASDEIGNTDRESVLVTVTATGPVPATPSGLSATAGLRSITLSWSDPDDDSITGYQYCDDNVHPFICVDIPGSGADTTSYTVSGLAEGVRYGFVVRARNNAGNSRPSRLASALTLGTKPALYVLALVASEGFGGRSLVQFVTSKTLSEPITFKYTITAEATDTATAGTDFVAVSTPTAAAIPAGSSFTNINMTVIDDNVYDQFETFTITISEPSSNVLVARAITRWFIEDDESPTDTAATTTTTTVAPSFVVPLAPVAPAGAAAATSTATTTTTVARVVPEKVGDGSRADVLSVFSACVGDAVGDGGFVDVEGLSAEEAVNCLAYYGIVVGKTGQRFDPSQAVTRSQLALMLHRAGERAGLDLTYEGAGGFDDINGIGEERRNAILALTHNEVMSGVTDSRFAPDVAATRLQVVSALVELLRLANPELFNNNGSLKLAANKIDYFTDTRAGLASDDDVVVSYAYELGLTTGSAADTNRFDPDGTVPRKHVAAFIARMLAHTNLRPAGLTAQGDGRTVVVSARDSDFQPIAGDRIDGFYVSTRDEAEAFDSTGECTTVVNAIKRGSTKCQIDTADPVTDTKGNTRLILPNTAGRNVTVWVWTDRTGTTYGKDTSAVKLQLPN